MVFEHNSRYATIKIAQNLSLNGYKKRRKNIEKFPCSFLNSFKLELYNYIYRHTNM